MIDGGKPRWSRRTGIRHVEQADASWSCGLAGLDDYCLSRILPKPLLRLRMHLERFVRSSATVGGIDQSFAPLATSAGRRNFSFRANSQTFISCGGASAATQGPVQGMRELPRNGRGAGG